ncbi:hypothetical protein NKG05_07745 [Oerskovia sp. M15]
MYDDGAVRFAGYIDATGSLQQLNDEQVAELEAVPSDGRPTRSR